MQNLIDGIKFLVFERASGIRSLSILIFLSLSSLASGSLSTTNPVEIYYFYDETCGICQEIKKDLFPSIEKNQGIRLQTHYFNIEEADNLNRLAFLEKSMGVRGKEFPVIIAGTNYLAGETEIKNRLSSVISGMISFGQAFDAPSKSLKQFDGRKKTDSVQSMAKILSPMPVILSGLADGVNPCAFATLIFLLSYLFFVKMERRMVFRMGLAYTLGVFVCYFLIGLGAFSALKALKTYALIGFIIKYVSVFLVAVFLILTIVDIVAYLWTKKADFILQLPDAIKKLIHARIRSKVSPSISLISSFGLGAVIAAFELVCTGQIYLPTVIYVLQSPELKRKGISYLLLYNTAFILPLLAIFTLVWIGYDQEKMEKGFRRHVIWLKLLLAVVFGILLVYLLKY